MLIDENGMNWFAAQGSGVTVYSAGSGGGVSGRSPAEQQMVEQDYFYLNWIVNASQNTASVESSYNFWNYLYELGYYIPVWGQCQLASNCIARGDYAQAAVHWLTGLGEALLITHGYYSSAGLASVKMSSKWIYGSFKSKTKWANQLAKRGWTEKQIGEAISKGRQFKAVNNVNKANRATRYVHPKTGQSVVIDDVTNELIHVGGPGFKY